MRIVISEFMDERAVARLSAVHDVLYEPALVDDSARLLSEAATADVLVVRNRTQVRGELLASLARCRAVGRLGVGLDNIDVPGCEARGMKVIPATGANAASVAEYVIGTSMVLLREAYGCTAEVAAGRWPRNAVSNGRELGGRTLGLIGFGFIGQLTGRLARGLGMQVMAYDAMLSPDAAVFKAENTRCASLIDVVTQSDVLSLHVPLLPSTRGLFDANRLALMKPGAVLVNTSRGGIVDEKALAQALREGHLGGAALDVFDSEPMPATPHFEGCPNLILTPHVAGVTSDSNERVSFLIADKVLEVLR